MTSERSSLLSLPPLRQSEGFLETDASVKSANGSYPRVHKTAGAHRRVLVDENCGARSLPCGTPVIVPIDRNVRITNRIIASVAGFTCLNFSTMFFLGCSDTTQRACGRPILVVA